MSRRQRAPLAVGARTRAGDALPTAAQIFDWAVVRQSDLGPGLQTCAEVFGCWKGTIRLIIESWDDPRGHMELVKTSVGGYRIEAYYNTSG